MMPGAVLEADRLELAQELPLALGEGNGRFHHHVAEEVAGRLAAHALDALRAQAENLAGLGLRRHADLGRAIQRGNGDLAAKRRGGDGDRHLAVKIVVVAREYRMRLDVDLQIEVAGRAAVHARLAFARKAHAVAFVDPGGNPYRERLLQLDPPAARAHRARIGNHAARAVAARAGLGNGERALRDAHLAGAAAGGAGRRVRARPRAGSLAALAGRRAGNADLRVEAVRGLLERDLQVVAQIGAAKHRRAAATPGAEDLTEDVAEDVAEAGARSAADVLLDAGVAELVVRRALVRIGEHFVGLLRLLEVLFGLGVLGIAVRMPFHGEAPVGLLQVLFAGVAVDAQHFVVVALRHLPSKQANGPDRGPVLIFNPGASYPVFLSFTSVNSASTTLPSSFFAPPWASPGCCDCCSPAAFACCSAYIFSPSFCAACASACVLASMSALFSDLSAPSASFTEASIFSFSPPSSLSP